MSKSYPHPQSDSSRRARHSASNTLPNQRIIAISQSNPYGDMEPSRAQPSNEPYSTYSSNVSGHPVVSEHFHGASDTTNLKASFLSDTSTLPVSLHTVPTKNVGEQPLRLGPLSTNVAPTLSGTSVSAPLSATDPINEHPSLNRPTLKSKKRREKPRIELAPDQPPTTQGKPRARVYVACVQCRTRKIRCDGAKPVCHNCGRRTSGDNECDYDAVPKRRGPDKAPGARQRLAREVRNQLAGSLSLASRHRRNRASSPLKLHKLASSGSSSLSPSSPQSSITLPAPFSIPLVTDLGTYGSNSPTDTSISPASAYPCYRMSSCPRLEGTDHSVNEIYSTFPHCRPSGLSNSETIPYGTRPIPIPSYTAVLNENENERLENCLEMVLEPSLSFARDTWWDSLLCLYMSPNSTRLLSLSVSQRATATQDIFSDLQFVFRNSNYWFSFFHIPSFFRGFFDVVGRKQMQPSLVLALLTMSIFWQSSEVDNGSSGRERALRFRDEAQGALEASVNAGWLDETLAQAAWLLSLFEVCAHPLHSTERSYSALVMLDSIIRSLSLTLVDVDNPHATTFLPGTVPIVQTRNQSENAWCGVQPLPVIGARYIPDSPPEQTYEIGCSCKSLTLGARWPFTNAHAPIKHSSAMLELHDLFIADPSNYALLFSGEAIAASPTSSKNTIWALQDRCFLLWHACIRMRADRRVPDADKAQFATRAWLEADTLEIALNRHTCEIERAFIYQAREYIFNTRLSISYEFQRFIPLVTTDVNGSFHRHKAEEWLRRQAAVAESFMRGLHTITGIANNLLARRPFFVFWFMAQIARSLSLWECDSTLTIALDVCKALLPAIDYLSALWPCAEQRIRYNRQRERLIRACYVAGVDLPPPPNYSLPSPSTPGSLV
ncbi:transcriptional regulator family: Fungal Specific TF [Agaricus bisporus var. burnettii]|uniref:Transcriptional regulator family: Fungal Specific TF n=1 Tax=Agaricus bisporus var. burnettii TaxID=192524 RepID=A0A8H7C6Z0_AGABI|nr:transcriptional regulator family: Fungal Specific TF [Agaricus bisporus var. burnettii]